MANGWIRDGAEGGAEREELYLPELRRRVAERGHQTADLAARFEREFDAVDRVLDLACGPGVHAVDLGSAGFDVQGIDVSRRYVEMARENAAEAGVADRATFTVGDMRALDEVGEFDAVTNRYNSFGYFADAENRAVIEGVHDSLLEGGVFVLELRNREWVASRAAERQGERLRGQHRVYETDYDPTTGRLERTTAVYDADGDLRGTYSTDVRLYAPVEIKRLCERIGFEATVTRNHAGDPLIGDEEWFVLFAVAE